MDSNKLLFNHTVRKIDYSQVCQAQITYTYVHIVAH